MKIKTFSVEVSKGADMLFLHDNLYKEEVRKYYCFTIYNDCLAECHYTYILGDI